MQGKHYSMGEVDINCSSRLGMILKYSHSPRDIEIKKIFDYLCLEGGVLAKTPTTLPSLPGFQQYSLE
jgi:hypothetical protein